jgi:hypothetical protein
MRLVRQMREHEGATWAKVARRLGISERALMQRVKGDGLRGTSWVRQNWGRLKDLRAHGATWRQIWLGNENPYATHNTLARAACEEFARRWARKYRDAVVVWELTRAGKPAQEIAGLVGVTERTVVRYRGHAPWYPQNLDLERALKLKARGLNWLEVNARMGRPCRNGTMLGLAVDMLLEVRDRFELG